MIINSIANTNFQGRTLVSSNNNNDLKVNISSPESNKDSTAKLPPLYAASVYMPRFAGDKKSLFNVFKVTIRDCEPLTDDPLLLNNYKMRDILKKNANNNGFILAIKDGLEPNLVEFPKIFLKHILKLIRDNNMSFGEPGKSYYFTFSSRKGQPPFSLREHDSFSSIFLNQSKHQEITNESFFEWLKVNNLVTKTESSNTQEGSYQIPDYADGLPPPRSRSVRPGYPTQMPPPRSRSVRPGYPAQMPPPPLRSVGPGYPTQMPPTSQAGSYATSSYSGSMPPTSQAGGSLEIFSFTNKSFEYKSLSEARAALHDIRNKLRNAYEDTKRLKEARAALDNIIQVNEDIKRFKRKELNILEEVEHYRELEASKNRQR